MSVLLDTHIWLWWLLGSQRLSPRERTGLDSLAEAGDLTLAAMSLWEAQLLHAKGRLQLDRPFDRWIRAAAATRLIQVLPLDVDVVIRLNALPSHFRGDPADRLIVATCLCHGLLLATHDKAIQNSSLVTIWPTSRQAGRSVSG